MTTDVKCECRYQGLCSCDLCAPEPANRTILHWMPTEYMEAARAAQGMFDALAVVEAERVKVLQAAAAAGAMMGVAVALAEEALRQHEAPEPVEDGAWIVTVADLRETRRGKRIGNIGPVYDFEEVPGWMRLTSARSRRGPWPRASITAPASGMPAALSAVSGGSATARAVRGCRT